MKKLQFTGVARAMTASRRAWVFGLAMAAAGVAHADVTQIQVWHTLVGANKAEFEKLAKQYNKEQNEVEVKLRDFPTQAALQQETAAALKAKKGPNLIQLADNHSPEVVAEHKAILPMYQLLAKYPVKDLNWFLPNTSSFTRDGKGRLLAFPWMAEVPVMFFNTALYKKAGLNPDQPARTWTALQGELLKLRDVADIDCPYASSNQVLVHLENLAPMNNQLYASNSNGLAAAKQAPAMQFDTLYMRHISLMVSWKRSLLLTAYANDNKPDSQFAKGECGVLTAGSSAFGALNNTRGLSFGVAPLPYYDQVTQTPGRPFVSGSALWTLEGNPASQEKATAQFLAWLSKPVVAAEWHQRTGYLPLTEAAFRASDVSFYNKIPGAQQLVASLRAQQVAPQARGFRIANYDRIENVLNTQLTDALDGKTPPVSALNNAVDQARNLAAQR
ncbi:extracellular solute-binding protein [Bordetella holmesii]|uniref:sn-glycerol-3-phosphate-binding periplasmic protein UgpB n=2 Tax=Bordetella holmesii TaxID=35814 RepID=A0A158M7K5_9BORD|nr:extracellular solute-binding protein [Bordetella holmesii]AIT25390.1 bacterial extracellular solute-binding family protein [Bordetella holmesii 44057]EWM45953.1 bacterial extracellular solute-binding family protein [Bordetella holmesii 70147]EWM48744.1 bacterial extracellular solute-binding family protein [Bordetella holmesii 41130]EWM50086.1 bacterial extracellular solute-binding family protein [Bordetella holmesii 35009]AMD44589.1 glycerol-3-phosphate ABC transporter substrate-binding pro